MNDDEITISNSLFETVCYNDTYTTYGFTNSFINDSMMDGMNWREIMSVYIEHNLLPSNLRNKLTHNR